MIKVKEWVSVKLLYEKGQSIKKIARLLKISRNTVRKIIKSESYRKYGEANKTNMNKSKSKAARYHEEIIRMLIKEKYIGTRIFEELQKLGFKGSRTALYDYLRKLKGNIKLSNISERYETGAGDLCQFDWSEYSVVLGDTPRKVYVFSTILCYSRYRRYSASLDVKQSSVIDALEDAFHFFGGVTKRLLVDNHKTMVNRHPKHSVEWNAKFLEVMGYYKIDPHACLPRKARTKGKVENPFFYLQEHFIKGTKFDSFDDFQKQLDEFNNKVNNRLHQGTNRIPQEQFVLEEKNLLKDLPLTRFIGVSEEFRKVSHDCLISVGSSKYSVPYMYAGKSVWIRIVRGCKLKVFSQKGNLIAEHNISTSKNQIIITSEHYKGLRRRKISDKHLLLHKFKQTFPDKIIFAEKLIAVQRFNSGYHLFKILETLKYYSKEDVEQALDKGLVLNSFSSNVIIGILRAYNEANMNPVSPLNISPAITQVNIKRDLVDYMQMEVNRNE